MRRLSPATGATDNVVIAIIVIFIVIVIIIIIIIIAGIVINRRFSPASLRVLICSTVGGQVEVQATGDYA
jgi:ABC-type transport system involved in multi-copper enzyme maturation permease subunit